MHRVRRMRKSFARAALADFEKGAGPSPLDLRMSPCQSCGVEVTDFARRALPWFARRRDVPNRAQECALRWSRRVYAMRLSLQAHRNNRGLAHAGYGKDGDAVPLCELQRLTVERLDSSEHSACHVLTCFGARACPVPCSPSRESMRFEHRMALSGPRTSGAPQ